MIKIIRQLLNYAERTVSISTDQKNWQTATYEVFFSEYEKEFLGRCLPHIAGTIQYAAGFWQLPTYYATLHDIKFHGNTAALVRKDALVSESIGSVVRIPHSPSYRRFKFSWGAKNCKGTYSCIENKPWSHNNVYHWLADCLPRLYSLSKVTESVQLIVSQKLPAWQSELLSLCLQALPHVTVVYIKPSEIWNLEKFIFPSFVSNDMSGYLPKEHLSFVRENIWKGYGIVPATLSRRKVYISRAAANKRRVTNEKELYPLLEKYGIEIVQAEKLSYKEQVVMFAAADLVIGVHGAGLANMIFSPQTTIVEIHPQAYLRSHYLMMAKGCGHSYHYLEADKADNQQNFNVSVEALESILKQLVG